MHHPTLDQGCCQASPIGCGYWLTADKRCPELAKYWIGTGPDYCTYACDAHVDALRKKRDHVIGLKQHLN